MYSQFKPGQSWTPDTSKLEGIDLNFKYYLSQIGVKGNMAYEYNPLHNYRLTQDTDSNGLHPQEALLTNKTTNVKEVIQWKGGGFYKNGQLLWGDQGLRYENADKTINGVTYSIRIFNSGDEDLVEGGTIVDLDTEHLNFSLNNPVEIEAQPSYDGSVNLILNDNRNIPRLINTRFTTRQLNTYEVVDRIGDNDTNLYDDSQFDLDTSLYKRVDNIPVVDFNGVLSFGNLKVGNYTFYFKYADADGNETDFVEQSGIISIFKGNDKDPFSIDGGIADMQAYKSVSFTLSNIDLSYDYVKVYYTRSSSDLDENAMTTAYEINKKFVVRKSTCRIIVTGEEAVTDIPLSEINVQYFLANRCRTQAQCQNRLFLANLTKPDIAYQDLTDISLRILPYLSKNKAKSLIGKVDTKTYKDNSTCPTNFEYYNTQNIYYHVGYWNEEMYRLGIVYIMSDNALSPVFNIRGTKNIPTLENLFDDKVGYTKYIDEDKTPLDQLYTDNTLLERTLIKVDEESYRITSGKSIFENAKGVIQIDDQESTQEMVYGIGIFIPQNIIEYLRTTHKIKGFFLVRQKRIPTILAQAYTLPRDPVAQVPLLRYGTDDNPNYAIERFLSDDAILTQDYKKRLYTKYSDTTLSLLYTSNELTAICPEFEVQQSYFNQFFTGTSYPVKTVSLQPDMLQQSNINNRFYYADFPETSGGIVESQNMTSAKIVSITDDVPLVAIEDTIYRGVLGSAEEAFRFRYAEIENRGKVKVPVQKKVFGATVTVQEEREPTNLVRGIFSPYLGIISANNIKPNKVVNIYIPGYSKGVMSNYFKIRYEDDSPYYPINGRISLSKFSNDWDTRTSGDYIGYTTECYRGDCYICNFTHRLNRNFQDPSAPMNDEIVDQNTWKENYSSESTDNFDKINRGDVNAVQLGSWITVRLRTSRNLSIRSSDSSNAGEMGLAGVPRGFYPLQQLTVHGNYKIPSSYLINGGFGNTTGEKQFFTLPDVPYIKNNFENRILYSDIAVNDAFKNGYRVFRSTTFNDYKKEYGSIIRILEYHNQLLCVFEHAIAVIAVNERTAMNAAENNQIWINSANVLPENIQIISDMFGSQWQESVIKTPYYVYGVDTVAKKIWRTNGQSIEILSDFKMNKFLIDNITLSERETTPIIGIRNVKTHYNANKGDVMFTFYDNTYGFEEKVWNLCFNETFNGHGGFVTFYSWVPSYSENIDNIFFSYDRKTSKYISKLGASKLGSTNADGVVLADVILDDTNDVKKLQIFGLENRVLPEKNKHTTLNISYSLEKDNFRNYEKFRVYKDNNDYWWLELKSGVTYDEVFTKERPVALLNIKANVSYTSDGTTDRNIVQYINNFKEYTEQNYGYYQSTIAITTKSILNNTLLTDADKQKGSLTTDFWKHGQAGLIDIKEEIKPTYWYGKQHPFEFEFVVRDSPNMHKIFDNLEIVSNKAEPESFHFEIVGESYEFADDKANMYYRQEATKELYQNLGSDILYNRNYIYIAPKQRPIYDKFMQESSYKDKSTIFPLYYRRVDTFEEIYDSYVKMDGYKSDYPKDYKNLSGSELTWNKDLNEFKIWTHIGNYPIDKFGRMRGNSQYLEDRWKIQIPSIVFAQKNEAPWAVPPIVINGVPEDLVQFNPRSIYGSWSKAKRQEIFGNNFDTNTSYDNLTETQKELIRPTITDSDLISIGVQNNSRVKNIYTLNDISTDAWTYRKEFKIRDKYVKVRIRYTGDQLAVITAVLTLYTESYA